MSNRQHTLGIAIFLRRIRWNSNDSGVKTAQKRLNELQSCGISEQRPVTGFGMSEQVMGDTASTIVQLTVSQRQPFVVGLILRVAQNDALQGIWL